MNSQDDDKATILDVAKFGMNPLARMVVGCLGLIAFLMIAIGALGFFLETTTDKSSRSQLIQPAAITGEQVFSPHLDVEARLRREGGDAMLRQIAGTIAGAGSRLKSGSIDHAAEIRTASFLFRAVDPEGGDDEPIAQFDYEASALRLMRNPDDVAGILGAATRSSDRPPTGEQEMRDACASAEAAVQRAPLCVEAAR